MRNFQFIFGSQFLMFIFNRYLTLSLRSLLFPVFCSFFLEHYFVFFFLLKLRNCKNLLFVIFIRFTEIKVIRSALKVGLMYENATLITDFQTSRVVFMK